MLQPANHPSFAGLSRLKLFFALSRTPHGLLDMCAPALAALLCLGVFPPVHIVLLGLLTAFAGYTAVYALNDVVDFHLDREKTSTPLLDASGDLDSLFVRHPMAQGLLSFQAGLTWAVCWAAVALLGAFLLHPLCIAIFLSGCLLEMVYCRLWRVTPYRTVVSGLVKPLGAIAAVVAVQPQPSAGYLLALFFLLFFWEIGGQNIPNDLIDLVEDSGLQAQTIPVRWGVRWSVAIVLASLALTVLMIPLLFHFSPLLHADLLRWPALAVGCFLLLWPGGRLYWQGDSHAALVLFNWASYFPATLLALILASMLF